MAVAAAVVAALAGCGGGDGGGSPGRPPDGQPVPWLRAAPAADGRTVRIGYESDPCTRARRAAIEESEDSVTVTLLDPDRDPDQACVALVKPGCAEVRLESPLAGRELVDGAPNPFPQSKRGAARLPFSRYGRCRPVREY